jgi:hypothetical protein
VTGIGDLPKQRDHAQFLQQHGVERDLIEAIENITQRVLCLDRLICMMIVSRCGFRTERDGRVME